MKRTFIKLTNALSYAKLEAIYQALRGINQPSIALKHQSRSLHCIHGHPPMAFYNPPEGSSKPLRITILLKLQRHTIESTYRASARPLANQLSRLWTTHTWTFDKIIKKIINNCEKIKNQAAHCTGRAYPIPKLSEIHLAKYEDRPIFKRNRKEPCSQHQHELNRV